MSNKQYGFYDEEYDDGNSCRTLMTGDGKALFTDLVFENGLVGIGFAYGLGQGVGKLVPVEEGTKAPDVGVEFQVKFECQESIDSLISTLLIVKNQLAKNNSNE